jgi:hypothetical protein
MANFNTAALSVIEAFCAVLSIADILQLPNV